MLNLSDKCCRGKSRILISTISPPPKYRAVYKIVWKNVVKPDRPQMKTLRLRFACWITKATNTGLKYVINIAFPRQIFVRMCINITSCVHCLSSLKMNCSKRYFEFGLMKEVSNIGHYIMRNMCQ